MPQQQVFHDAFKDRVMLVGIEMGPLARLSSRQDADDLLQH